MYIYIYIYTYIYMLFFYVAHHIHWLVVFVVPVRVPFIGKIDALKNNVY